MSYQQPATGSTIQGGLNVFVPGSEGTSDAYVTPINANGNITLTAADTLTAHAGGGQASALALTSELNRVTTVATAGDSVALPASAPGLEVVVINSGANAMQVFGAGTETINGVATATGVPQPAATAALYRCVTAGAWFCASVGLDAEPGVLKTTVTIANAAVLTLYSVGTALLIPAQGAGTLIEVLEMVVENEYLTAAFAAGGAIQANYGSAAVTHPATATIAATFLTSPAANQMIKVLGALASTLSSAVLNTGIYLTAATQDFTTGGGSLIVKIAYRVHSGL